MVHNMAERADSILPILCKVEDAALAVCGLGIASAVVGSLTEQWRSPECVAAGILVGGGAALARLAQLGEWMIRFEDTPDGETDRQIEALLSGRNH